MSNSNLASSLIWASSANLRMNTVMQASYISRLGRFEEVLQMCFSMFSRQARRGVFDGGENVSVGIRRGVRSGRWGKRADLEGAGGRQSN